MLGKQRNFGLDILRAVSILCVLTAHKFTLPIELGIVGVQIFFVLSGFLIGQILIKDFNENVRLKTLFNFWKRRWFRTLPVYYLVLILKIIIQGNPYGWKILVYFLFLQANFVGIDFLGISWSLVVEEWFYLVVPIAFYFFFKNGINSNKFIWVLSFLILFFLASRFIWNYFHFGVIIYQFDCLLLGVGLAFCKLRYQGFYLKLKNPILFFFALIGVIALTMQLGNMNQWQLFDAYFHVIWYFIISSFIVFLIPYMEQSDFMNNQIKSVNLFYYFFTWTSILTYSIYLIHMEIFGLFVGTSDYLRIPIQIVLIYITSIIIYSLFEHPVMTLRDKFSITQFTGSIKSFSLKLS